MIQLRTFGGVDLRDSAGRDMRPLLSQPKRLALLTYIALAHASGFCRRDKVVALFWPELDEEHARGSLRQALTFLRRALGDGVIVTRGEEEIGVDPGVLECDAATFVAACAADRHREAMTAYRGDFLDGFFVSDAAPEFQSWVDDQRAELRRRAAVCTWSLAEAFRAAGDRANATASARQAVAFAPESEGELARLVRFLDGLGERAGAIGAYEEFAAALKREYDADPAPETQALIRSVRARTEAAPSPSAPRAPVSARIDKNSSSDGPAAQRTRSIGRRPLYLAAALVVAVAGYFVVSARRNAPLDEAGVTVAVIPFEELSSDHSRQYVADGMTDELITDLARSNALHVINTATMMSYRDSGLASPAIASRLHANIVVSCTLQFLGDTVHQTVQLSSARQNRMLWARTFDGTRSGLLRMQLEISRDLTRAIRGPGARVAEAEAGRPPQNPDAIDLYIKGRRQWSKPTRVNLLASIDSYGQALDADPSFALAYSGIADAYVRLGYGSWLAPDDAFLKAEAAANKALELDSTLAEPHATLGFVSMYYHWDWRRAEQEFKRSLALNPSYATAHEWYGLFLAAMGRFDEALSNESQAKSLDQLSTTIAGTTGWVLHYAGRQNDAQRELQIAIRTDSTYFLGHLYLGRVYQAQGKLDSALSQYAQAGPLRGWVPTIAGEGYVYGLLGRQHEAVATLSRMDSIARRGDYVTAYAVALVYASLGNRDSAFAWLERGVGERTHWLVWLNRDPRWAPLRSDPRFAALVREVGLPR
jgi:DNA-binding SARP family transcriptional activator/TolB-like protein/Tfp pilus assembly protein PilF